MPRRHRQLQDALLLGLGLAAGLGWWNFSAFNHPGFGHPSDTFHYYVGSKYFPELGYQRLYLCTAVADAEAGLRSQVEARSLRDLASNQLVSAAIATQHPETCTARFSPERWAAFAHDIGWFRSRVPARRWQAMQTDHGYNATPLWTALGGGLANRVPASDASILALRLIDPLLLAALWLAVTLCFGWRAACVAALYWGTNYPAQYGWTGGSFLRQGWLAASVLALCALRRGRPATAGALLAVATGLRIFPIFILAALGIQALVAMFRAGRVGLAPAHRRLAAGALAAGGALFAFSLLSGDGARAWSAFIEDSRAHLATPLRNYVGLATVVSYVPNPAPARVAGARAGRSLRRLEGSPARGGDRAALDLPRAARRLPGAARAGGGSRAGLGGRRARHGPRLHGRRAHLLLQRRPARVRPALAAASEHRHRALRALGGGLVDRRLGARLGRGLHRNQPRERALHRVGDRSARPTARRGRNLSRTERRSATHRWLRRPASVRRSVRSGESPRRA